ncbi:MAG: uracil-DNA glycosylase [Clostridia bacterium]|nr:uracil-DNA glycosylase [Clostridia bacterium]
MTWEELENKCRECTACELHKTRTNLVFGTGNREADLMFIGEAPGESEDLSGTPFVGRAGKLFDKYLEAVDIPRESVYIANMLKCRPPKNRDPLPAEQDVCIEYLREQVRLIKPKLIVCLGRISAMRLIKPDFKIMKEHGIWYNKNGFEICAVFHPSLLLRDPRQKEAMLTDMKAVKARLDALKDEKKSDS